MSELLKINRPERHEQQQHAEDEPEVADTVDDERLLAGVVRRLLRKIEADE